MKRWISCFFVLGFILFMLCGCVAWESGTQGDRRDVSYPLHRDVIESPTRILYLENGWLRYYNKLDGGTYPFCFDPLCDHDYFENLGKCGVKI